MSRGGTPLPCTRLSIILFLVAVEASPVGKKALILKFAHGLPLSWIFRFTESRTPFRANTRLFYMM